MDNVADDIGEMLDEKNLAIRNPRARNRALRDTRKGQRKLCKPFKFNGLSFFTFILLEKDDLDVGRRAPYDLASRRLAVYKDEKLVAFCNGSPEDGEIVLMEGRKIRQIFGIWRKRLGGGVTSFKVKECKQPGRNEELKEVSRRLLTGNLVKFTSEDARERARFYGFIPEFDEIYK